MKNCKSILSRLVCVVLAAIAATACMTVSASAAEPVAVNESIVMPRLNNGALVSRDFYIDSNGEANVFVQAVGSVGLTTGITIEIQLQRKGLLWWSDVDGGYWYESFSGTNGLVSDSIQLEKTGKYRAVITVTVSGTGGADDVIEDTLTYEY